MRAGAVILASVLTALAPPASRAQVTVNPGALDALASRPAPERRPPARRSPPRPPAPAAKPGPATAAKSAKPAKPEKPAIPVAPPAIANLPPPVAVPVAHPPPAPTIPLAEGAPGAAHAIANGLRVTFGADRAELNADTAAALHALGRELKDKETPINIYAYAAGSAEDPSTPRRLSLSRALAARAVLLAEGIPSARIYPRALGPAAGDAERDRVDVIAGPPGAPAP